MAGAVLIGVGVNALVGLRLGRNARFVAMMAVGSVVGSFIGRQLLGLVPAGVLLPLLAASAAKIWRQGTHNFNACSVIGPT